MKTTNKYESKILSVDFLAEANFGAIGFVSDNKWNGFYVPVFKKSIMNVFAKMLNNYFKDFGSEEQAYYDVEKDVFTYVSESDEATYVGCKVSVEQVTEQTVTCYSIGDSWTWYAYEDEQSSFDVLFNMYRVAMNHLPQLPYDKEKLKMWGNIPLTINGNLFKGITEDEWLDFIYEVAIVLSGALEACDQKILDDFCENYPLPLSFDEYIHNILSM